MFDLAIISNISLPSLNKNIYANLKSNCNLETNSGKLGGSLQNLLELTYIIFINIHPLILQSGNHDKFLFDTVTISFSYPSYPVDGGIWI